jgi:SAM-dependent methyltransferase
MSSEPTYEDYVTDPDMSTNYVAYQQRYNDEPRESDKVVIELVRAEVAGRGSVSLDLLDAGCSTGNLLRHLRRALPGVRLTGGELQESALVACRADAELEGVSFERLDVTDLGLDQAFDVIVVNAVFYMMTDEVVQRGFRSVAQALRPGGALVAFDFFHPYPQDLAIMEKSASWPNGLMLHFRQMATVERMLVNAGFESAHFEPFRIPIDLERGKNQFGANASGFEDLNSYTVRTENQDRLLFRGTLFQPWCHLVARKAG